MIIPPDPEVIFDMVNKALDEDLGRGDITSRAIVRPGLKARGSFLAKQDLVLAGLEVADAAFTSFDPYLQIESAAADGEEVKEGKVFARVTGDAQMLLAAERVALNFLQRLSGIATITRRYVEAVAGTGAKIVDTRKTTPGLRLLEKYAVTAGGGHNHRLGLDDGVLIKDNHIAMVGGVAEAVRRARETVGHLHKIEVEVASLDQVREALQARADILLLDNMAPEMVREAVEILKQREPDDRRTLTEASGGITLANVRAYAEAGVDLISIGALTHSAPAVDISFKIKMA
ncbi:MAG: carboxylating nicotinate-nucleotide diphosphorylase [Blastocatellia bacterium]|jgi:nicotinate-nucleotide pyrophosphorylase (carboxylating)|nr:carboxylating nicotinate-nucleotide diphosphorylase [Blastocatellia bacterium]